MVKLNLHILLYVLNWPICASGCQSFFTLNIFCMTQEMLKCQFSVCQREKSLGDNVNGDNNEQRPAPLPPKELTMTYLPS